MHDRYSRPLSPCSLSEPTPPPMCRHKPASSSALPSQSKSPYPQPAAASPHSPPVPKPAQRQCMLCHAVGYPDTLDSNDAPHGSGRKNSFWSERPSPLPCSRMPPPRLISFAHHASSPPSSFLFIMPCICCPASQTDLPSLEPFVNRTSLAARGHHHCPPCSKGHQLCSYAACRATATMPPQHNRVVNQVLQTFQTIWKTGVWVCTHRWPKGAGRTAQRAQHRMRADKEGMGLANVQALL